MTNKEKYREYLQQLQQIYSANEAAAVTDLVFEKIAGLQRSDIIKDPGQYANGAVLKDLDNCLTKLMLHEPVQYVLGEAWFCKMRLTVNEKVLIPRPETEELVQLIIDDWLTVMDTRKAPAEAGLSILDIGTGSGCIAIAVKKNLSRAAVHAIDISADALSVAKENAIDQQVDITFLQVDFLDENDWKMLPLFDIIVSNPPYIPTGEKAKLDKNVTAFEPHTALFVPQNEPLLFYKKIAGFGKQHLRANGKIYVEMHEDFAKATSAVFEQSYKTMIKKDMFGKERTLSAQFAG